MAISFGFLDDFVRDYFQYRNLTSTSRSFENELTKIPIERYRADEIIEQITVYIHQFEITSLLDYWSQIEQILLANLNVRSHELISIFSKIRLNFYRCYLIHAVQSNKLDKINEFYERLYKVLQQTAEWTKEWFALPFIQNPEENITFQIYFSKQWNELFWISLQNFLAAAFYNVHLPIISTVETEDDQGSESIDDLPTSTLLSKLRAKYLSK
mgnify:CR=1 FL=1